MDRPHALTAGIVLLLLASGGCRPGEDGPAAGSAPGEIPPVLVLAVDALEWGEILPRVADGQLPVLAGLMRGGRYGFLRSMVPSVSPVIWTTVATGRSPDEHGIRGFAKVDVAGGPATTLFNNYDRHCKAFWNILSERGRRVGVVGWWMTYPVDSVNGVMVAQVNTLDALGLDPNRPLMGGLVTGASAADVPGQVFPGAFGDELLGVGARVASETDARTADIFGEAVARTTGGERKLWQETAWAVRADATYLAIAQALDPASFDVFAVYLGGIDVVGHRFWRYAHPESFEHPPTPREVAQFGRVVGDYYTALDAEIGRLLARYDGPVTVIVLSDHGMHATNRDHRWADGDVTPLSGHHDDGPPGVVILSGPGVAPAEDGALPSDPRELRTLGSILDVLPTLLSLTDLAPGSDLPGDAWQEDLEDGPALPPTASYEVAAWTRARLALAAREVVDPGSEERIEQLRALGYVH